MHSPLLQEKVNTELTRGLKNEPEKIKMGSTFTPVTELFRQDSWGSLLEGLFLLMLVGCFFFFTLLFTGCDFSRVSPACNHKACRWAQSSPASTGVLEEITKCWENGCWAPRLPGGHSLDLALTWSCSTLPHSMGGWPQEEADGQISCLTQALLKSFLPLLLQHLQKSLNETNSCGHVAPSPPAVKSYWGCPSQGLTHSSGLCHSPGKSLCASPCRNNSLPKQPQVLLSLWVRAGTLMWAVGWEMSISMVQTLASWDTGWQAHFTRDWRLCRSKAPKQEGKCHYGTALWSASEGNVSNIYTQHRNNTNLRGYLDSHVNAEARNTNETFMSLLKAIDLGSYSYNLRNHPATAMAFFSHSSGQLFTVNLWFAYAQKKKQFI